MPLVDIPVDDEDAPCAKLARARGGDGDAIEEAKAHGAMRLGVMAGRAHDREPVAHRAPEHRLGELENAAAREARRLERSAARKEE